MSKRRHTASDQQTPRKEGKMVLEPLKPVTWEGKYCIPATTPANL
jgi:hypothetical protein